jgi:hypothetical protein
LKVEDIEPGVGQENLFESIHLVFRYRY